MENGKLKTKKEHKNQHTCSLAPCGRGKNFGTSNEFQKFG